MRELEDELGWETIRDANKRIGKWLGFVPKIEWTVSNGDSSCYHPSQVGNHYASDWQQKAACEKFMEEQRKDFPDGWVIKEGFAPTRNERWPHFHVDWDMLMEAAERLEAKQNPAKLTTNINEVWKQVAEKCPDMP